MCKWCGGGAEDASLAPDKTAGALDGARSLRTGSCASLSERESDCEDPQVKLRDEVVDRPRRMKTTEIPQVQF